MVELPIVTEIKPNESISFTQSSGTYYLSTDGNIYNRSYDRVGHAYAKYQDIIYIFNSHRWLCHNYTSINDIQFTSNNNVLLKIPYPGKILATLSNNNVSLDQLNGEVYAIIDYNNQELNVASFLWLGPCNVIYKIMIKIVINKINVRNVI